MANFTEKDITNHLKDRFKLHKQETKCIENVLNAFNSDATSAKVKREASVEAGDTDALKGKPVKPKLPSL